MKKQNSTEPDDQIYPPGTTKETPTVEPTSTLKRICSAHSKSRGRQCKRQAIPGGTVCMYHGGKAPQVIAAARLRLLTMIDPTITELYKCVKDKKLSVVKTMAIRDLLDRAGLKPGDRLSVEVERIHDPGRERLTDEQLSKLIEMLEEKEQVKLTEFVEESQ